MAGNSQRRMVELRIAISSPAAIAVTTGSSTSELASGLIRASGMNTIEPSGATSSGIAASLGGSFHQAM